MVPFDVVTRIDDMVCNSGGVTVLCKSFEINLFFISFFCVIVLTVSSGDVCCSIRNGKFKVYLVQIEKYLQKQKPEINY